MDPADIQRALSGQGIAIGSHEQSLKYTHEQVASLAHSVNTLVQRLDSAIGSGAIGGSQTNAGPELYACDPEPYDGDLNKCRGFLLQCRLVFSQRARLFPTDISKINHIIGLLRGRALAWAQASAGTRLGDPSLDTFVARFERIFDRPNYAGCAGDRLFTIRQGVRSVADYAVEFSTLSAESGWNEPALLCAFRRGLNNSVRDALVSGARPRDLAEMVDRAIELDNHQPSQPLTFLCFVSFFSTPRSIVNSRIWLTF